MKQEEKVGLIITFKDIFPEVDYKLEDSGKLIQDIPKNACILLLSYLNLCSFYFQFSEGFQDHVLKIWYSRFPDSVRKQIDISKFQFEHTQGKYGHIINPQTSLKVIELALKVCKEGGTSLELSPEQELRLFKAYLLISEALQQEQLDKFSESGKDITSLEDIYFYKILPLIVSSGDHVNIDLKSEIFSQLSKGIFLFRFLKQSKILSPLLDAFLQARGILSWEKYLEHIVSIIFTFTPKGNDFNVTNELYFPDPSEPALDLAKRLSINLNIDLKTASINTMDHRDQRMFPLYDIGNNSFYCLSASFLFNKLFDGLFWELNSISKSLEPKIEYLGRVRKEFTEEFVLYSQLERIFKKSFTLSGREQSNFYQIKHGKDIEKTDFYARNSKYIYLFECKDNSLSSESKVSQDINRFSEFLSRPKDGVKQLARSIKELNLKSFEFDEFEAKGLKRKNIVIQPILVVTDRSLKVNGINTVVYQM
jgi:hypothetical protein